MTLSAQKSDPNKHITTNIIDYKLNYRNQETTTTKTLFHLLLPIILTPQNQRQPHDNMYSNFRIIFLILTTIVLYITSSPFTNVDAFTNDHPSSSPTITKSKYNKVRQEWNERSVSYYSKVMREERRRSIGQINNDIFDSEQYQQDFERSAQKHYFALRKIKDGQYVHAEIIYKKIIQDIMKEDEDEDGQCDHAKLAVTTLLLALHCQRMGDLKKTRSVFLNFFREVVMSEQRNNVNNHHDHDDGKHHECACSAKVLGAFALFEMKQGNTIKSLEILQKAVEFDPALGPILQWKQFRDVQAIIMKRRRKEKWTTTTTRRQSVGVASQ